MQNSGTLLFFPSKPSWFPGHLTANHLPFPAAVYQTEWQTPTSDQAEIRVSWSPVLEDFATNCTAAGLEHIQWTQRHQTNPGDGAGIVQSCITEYSHTGIWSQFYSETAQSSDHPHPATQHSSIQQKTAAYNGHHRKKWRSQMTTLGVFTTQSFIHIWMQSSGNSSSTGTYMHGC